jgi:hypothetical protein
LKYTFFRNTFLAFFFFDTRWVVAGERPLGLHSRVSRFFAYWLWLSFEGMDGEEELYKESLGY